MIKSPIECLESLVSDEENAVAAYTKAIAKVANSASKKAALEHIREEEKEHKSELKSMMRR